MLDISSHPKRSSGALDKDHTHLYRKDCSCKYTPPNRCDLPGTQSPLLQDSHKGGLSLEKVLLEEGTEGVAVVVFEGAAVVVFEEDVGFEEAAVVVVVEEVFDFEEAVEEDENLHHDHLQNHPPHHDYLQNHPPHQTHKSLYHQ